MIGRKKLCFERGQVGNMYVVPSLSILHRTRLCILKVLINHVTASGLEKTYYLAVLTHFTDSTELLPLLVYKSKIIPSDKIPQGINIHNLANEWMEESELKVWLEKERSKLLGGLMNSHPC